MLSRTCGGGRASVVLVRSATSRDYPAWAGNGFDTVIARGLISCRPAGGVMVTERTHPCTQYSRDECIWRSNGYVRSNGVGLLQSECNEMCVAM